MDEQTKTEAQIEAELDAKKAQLKAEVVDFARDLGFKVVDKEYPGVHEVVVRASRYVDVNSGELRDMFLTIWGVEPGKHSGEAKRGEARLQWPQGFEGITAKGLRRWMAEYGWV